MPAHSRIWKSAWKVGLRVWIQNGGRAVLGKGRLELLEAIDRFHSISEAARQMGMSYRRAWLLVQSINKAAGEQLVTKTQGGSHGGGARLTPEGRTAIAVFRELQDTINQRAATVLRRLVRIPNATTIHLAAAVSLQEALSQLLADYTLKRPSVRVRVLFGASDELAEHLEGGSPFELFITADPAHLDRLESQGIMAPASRTVLAENSLAVVGSKDLADFVRRPSDLKRPEVERIALADASTPLGRYTWDYLKSKGLLESLQPRAVHAENAAAVLSCIRSGQAQAGFVYGSDAVRMPDCVRLFPIGHLATAIRYTASSTMDGYPKLEVKEFLEFLASPSATSRFRLCGFLPVRNKRTSK
ncbi:MAG: molybdate ABC transporter substrate-binding protein [Gemmataceae bacterium]